MRPHKGTATLPGVSPIFDSGVTLGKAAAQRLARLREAELARIERGDETGLSGDLHKDAIGPGLSGAELARIEGDYEIEFSDDHRAFLAAGLPYRSEPLVSNEQVCYTWEWPWPDWRNGDPDRLRRHVEGLTRWALHDIERGRVWTPAWGRRPADDAEARRIARDKLGQAPRMIPVYAHRYLPGGSGTFGFPVLSIWQTTDVIVYGSNLDDYIQNEFGNRQHSSIGSTMTAKPVPFWSDFLR